MTNELVTCGTCSLLVMVVYVGWEVSVWIPFTGGVR